MEIKLCCECGLVNPYDETECTRCGCIAFAQLPILVLMAQKEFNDVNGGISSP
jgi:hypothetical protein